jgi:hypothetical protein
MAASNDFLHLCASATGRSPASKKASHLMRKKLQKVEITTQSLRDCPQLLIMLSPDRHQVVACCSALA